MTLDCSVKSHQITLQNLKSETMYTRLIHVNLLSILFLHLDRIQECNYKASENGEIQWQ